MVPSSPRTGRSRSSRASSSRRSSRATTRSTNPWLARNSARWKPGGSSAAIVPAVTRAPAKPMSASGSAMLTSPTAANEANTPPVVGSDRMDTKGTPAMPSRSRAAIVLASCMSASVPSCIRAPPDALTTMSGTRAARACSAARVTFSPTTAPIEPPMNPKSMTHRATARAADRAGPPHGRVAHAGRQLGRGEPVGVGLLVDEPERIDRLEVRVVLVPACRGRGAARGGPRPTAGSGGRTSCTPAGSSRAAC